MSRKFLTTTQIRLLSPNKLLEYKQELNKIYYEMQEEIEDFVAVYANTKKVLAERLKATEKAIKLAEQDRINLDPDHPSIVYDDSKLSIN